jgi:hypothetical protein
MAQSYGQLKILALIKILSRISVGGTSMVSGVVCAVVDGWLDLSARATSFFI